MTEFLRQICSLIKTSLPLLRPVYRNRHDQIRLPFPQFFLRISIHCSGIKITVFSASIVLISGNRSSHYAIIDKNTSSLFIHMPVFLTVSAVFPCFYGFSTFITSGMTNRTKFFLAFRTDYPSLICQYFLTDRTASRVKISATMFRNRFISISFHYFTLCFAILCISVFSYYRNKFFLCYYSVIRSQSAISFFTICIIIPCSLTQFSDPFIQCTVSLLLFFIAYHLCKGLLVSHNRHTFSCSGNCGIKKVPV